MITNVVIYLNQFCGESIMKRYEKPSINELIAISSNFISDGSTLISGTEPESTNPVKEVTNKDVFDIRF